MKKKLYEVNGVIEYANCFRVEVEASSAIEAKKMVLKKLHKMADPAIAEFQGGIVDKGIEVKKYEKK